VAGATAYRVFIAADAATRAAGRTYSLTGNLVEAKAKANTSASMNLVAGKAMTLVDSDFTSVQQRLFDVARREAPPPDTEKPKLLQFARPIRQESGDGLPFLT
jgi:hypothetical protein